MATGCVCCSDEVIVCSMSEDSACEAVIVFCLLHDEDDLGDELADAGGSCVWWITPVKV